MITPREKVIKFNELFGEELEKIIDSNLTDKQLICFKMYFFENLNQNEIGKQLCISQATVSRTLKTSTEKIVCYIDFGLDVSKKH